MLPRLTFTPFAAQQKQETFSRESTFWKNQFSHFCQKQTLRSFLFKSGYLRKSLYTFHKSNFAFLGQIGLPGLELLHLTKTILPRG